MNTGIYVSDLSTSYHIFHRYHFCRGNNNKRKSRLGLILQGSGTYIYLGKKLKVEEGDVVFIPENVYCYSEWRSENRIEVVYISCFMHYESFKYEPQIIDVSENTKNDILQIAALLSDENRSVFSAYSKFYHLLDEIFAQLKPSEIAYDKTLSTATEYITDHYAETFSVEELARHCCVSESTIYHLFKRELGQTPIHFLNSIRINLAIEYLENTNYSISTISQMVGYKSENHFRRIFTDLAGTTPLKYRRGGSKAGE